jgi:hypothetical protein
VAARRIHVHIGRITVRGGGTLEAEQISAAIRAEVLGAQRSRDGAGQNAAASRTTSERIGAAVAAAIKNNGGGR